MTEVGHLDLEVLRDRSGTFEPQTVRKGQRRLDGVDKLVMDPRRRQSSQVGRGARLVACLACNVARRR